MDILDGIYTVPHTDLLVFFQTVLNTVIALSALVAVIFLIYAGFQYITSGGDDAKVESAQRTIIYVIVGLIICFISPLIVNFVLDYIVQV